MTVFEWLELPINEKQTVIQRLAELIFKNGGYIAVDPKGKTALKDLQEILDLTAMHGCLDGFTKATDGKDWPQVKELLEKENSKLAAMEKTDMASLVGQTLTRGYC